MHIDAQFDFLSGTACKARSCTSCRLLLRKDTTFRERDSGARSDSDVRGVDQAGFDVGRVHDAFEM